MIYLLEIDHLPACYLGCYGELRYQTPTFDAIASQSLVCNHFFRAGELILAESNLPLHKLTRYQWTLPQIEISTLMQAADGWLSEEEVGQVFTLNEDDDHHGTSSVDFLARIEEQHGAIVRANIESTAITFEYDAALNELFEGLDLEDDDVLIICGKSGDPKRLPSERPECLRETSDAETHLPLLIFFVNATEHVRVNGLVSINDVTRLIEALGSVHAYDVNQWIHSLNNDQIELHFPRAKAIRTKNWLLVDSRSPVEQKTESVAEHTNIFLFRKPEDLWEIVDVASQFPDLVEHYLQSNKIGSVASVES